MASTWHRSTDGPHPQQQQEVILREKSAEGWKDGWMTSQHRHESGFAVLCNRKVFRRTLITTPLLITGARNGRGLEGLGGRQVRNCNRLGLARLGLARLCSDWLGSARLGSAKGEVRQSCLLASWQLPPSPSLRLSQSAYRRLWEETSRQLMPSLFAIRSRRPGRAGPCSRFPQLKVQSRVKAAGARRPFLWLRCVSLEPIQGLMHSC